MSVPLQDLMARVVVTASPDDTLGEVRRHLSSLDIGAIPVVDQGLLVGIVTSDDLVTDYPATMPVSRVMSTPVRTLSPQADSSEAAATMREHTCHHIVVTENDAVVGIISSLDLLSLLSD
jgi:CBS domain-containing protein